MVKPGLIPIPYFNGRIRPMPYVLLRNSFELMAVLCFVVALANMPIADLTALGQISPMLLLIGVAVLYRDPIGWARAALIAIGFVGAICVAQPGASGISLFAVLGLGCAVGTVKTHASRGLAALRRVLGNDEEVSS